MNCKSYFAILICEINLEASIKWAQYADGESNKIVYNKKKTVTARKYNTY